MTRPESPRSLRRSYLEWIEEQVENYKESIPRGELLRLADHVVEELRVNPRGQYQITELLLCDAVDRHIIRLLKLPSYRAWVEKCRVAIPLPVVRAEPPAPEPAPAAEPLPAASVA